MLVGVVRSSVRVEGESRGRESGAGAIVSMTWIQKNTRSLNHAR